MKRKGIISRVLKEESGISQRTGSTWKSLPFVFEFYDSEDDRYPQRIKLDEMNEANFETIRTAVKEARNDGRLGAEVEAIYTVSVIDQGEKTYNRFYLRSLNIIQPSRIDGQQA
jgi:hypothetical protein